MQLHRMMKKLVKFFHPVGVRKNAIGGGNSPMKKNRQVPSSAWHFDDHAQKIENRFKNLWKKYQQIFRIQTWLESTKHFKKMNVSAIRSCEIFRGDCSDFARMTVQHVFSCDQLKMNRFEHHQHSRNCAKRKSQGTTIYAITITWKFACSAGL